jgi:hypothetical protein
MEELRRRLFLSMVFIVLVISFGVAGYMVIEGWNFFDSFYMTIITLTTVGYREIHDLSFDGQLFTIVLIIGGVGTVLYALSTGAKFVLEGELQEIYGRKRLEKKLKDLREHYIVCGYGRMGKIIARELKHEKLKYIVIEKNEVILDPDEKEEFLIIQGDATKDELLKKAGIEKAKCLISILPTDGKSLRCSECAWIKFLSLNRCKGGRRRFRAEIAQSRCRQGCVAISYRWIEDSSYRIETCCSGLYRICHKERTYRSADRRDNHSGRF